MLRILKSPEAENDLDEIWLYIAQDNPCYADKLLDEIEETSQKLARFPNMGRNRDERNVHVVMDCRRNSNDFDAILL